MPTPPPVEIPPPPKLSVRAASPPPVPTRHTTDLDLEPHPDNEGRRYQSVVAALISSTIHLVLLLVLAFLARKSFHSDAIVIRLAGSDGERELASLDVFSVAPPEPDAGDTSAAMMAEIEPFDVLSETQVASPDFASEDKPQNGGGGSPAKDNDSSKEKPHVSFFGTHAYGNKFVYVLDVSGSMLAGSGARIRRARQELIRSINQLQPHQSFYVVLYSNYAVGLNGERRNFQLLPATPENKKLASRWISYVNPSGGTFPGGALKIAGDLAPDAIFFLSDGEFVYYAPDRINGAFENFLQGFGQARPSRLRPSLISGALYPQEVLDAFDPDIVVHTVALESEKSRRLMKMIADVKGGEHRFIAAPNRPTQRRRR